MGNAPRDPNKNMQMHTRRQLLSDAVANNTFYNRDES
jgi:hypothetical protein